MGKLQFNTSKILKLQNVLKSKIDLENQDMDLAVLVEKMYSMESVLRVTDCMYCRYMGPEEQLKIAYDKINVEAFENDIELEGESYTVFVDENEEEGTIVADVFVPKKNS